MFFETSTQLKTCSRLRKSGISPNSRFMSMMATESVPSSRTRLSARFTAIVVVPTPPLTPRTLMICPLRTGPLCAAGVGSEPSLSLSRALRSSASLTGWGMNSFTPMRMAWISTSGFVLLHVMKNSRALFVALARFRVSKSRIVSSPISKTRRSDGIVSWALWIKNPSIEAIMTESWSLSFSFLISSLTVFSSGTCPFTSMSVLMSASIVTARAGA